MRRLLCWMTALAMISLAAPGAAQAPPDAAAKNAAKGLAETGKKRFADGDYAGAIEALRDAEKYFRAPTITRLRALSHEKLNQLLEAREIYTQLAGEQLAADAPSEFWKAQTEAKKSLESLEKRIPKVEVMIAHAPAGTRVTLDGKVLDAAVLAQPIRLNPGKYTIVIEPPGMEKVTRTLDLKEGSTEKVDVDLAPPAVVVVVPTAQPTTSTTAIPSAPPSVAAVPTGVTSASAVTSSSAAPRLGSMPVAGYVAYGAGAASLIVGAVFGGLAIASKSEFDKHPSNQTADEGERNILVADVAFVVAVASAFAGTTAWTLFPSADKPTRVKVTRKLLVTPTVGGVIIGGSF